MDKEQIRIAEVLSEMGLDDEVIEAITGQKKRDDKADKSK